MIRTQTTQTPQTPSEQLPSVRFAWLELTGKCNLNCVHCYADSGPAVPHGSIDVCRWKALIDELAEMGTSAVQFIGGEPTIFPGFPDLVKYAASKKLSVEVYSNLTHLSDSLIDLFKSYGVSVATSYYSNDPLRHEQVTRSPRSHSRTLTNISRLVAEGIPLRAAIIKVHDDQTIEEACDQLKSIGVTDIHIDHLRGVGRGRSDKPAGVEALCGACSDENLAIASDGTVFPCIFARWLSAGNVRTSSLTEVLATGSLSNHKVNLAESFSKRKKTGERPKKVGDQCGPVDPHCGPCTPWIGCSPKRSTPKKRTPTKTH